jgi:uncharacterized lipoprotein YehR (DUF1307 family)
MAGRHKGSIKTGGRKRGTPNKATQEIKTLLAEEIDFRKVVRCLKKMMSGNNAFNACKLLLEYQYGKPKEKVEVDYTHEELDALRRIAGQVMEERV